MVRRSTLSLAALLVVVPSVLFGFQAAGSSTAQMVGWYSATVDQTGASGTVTYTPGGTSLPAGLTIYLDSSSALHANGGAGAGVNANGTGTPNGVLFATVMDKGTIMTSLPAPTFLTWKVQVTYTTASSANGEVYNAGATSQGKGLTFLSQIATPVVTATRPESEKDGPNYTLKRTLVVDATSWNGPSGGKTAAFQVPLYSVGGQAFAKSGNPGGNFAAAQAASAGDTGVKITGVSGKSSGTGTVTMNAPTGLLAVFMDIYNTSGNLVDQWMIDRYTDGTCNLDVDNYAAGQYTLLIHARGTLVSKITATLDPGGSATITPMYRFGDLDGDNVVSQDEINFIRYHLGANANAANSYFSDLTGPYTSSSYTIHDADFDGDGTITQADLDLATPNIGVHGDSL